jgi:rRNA maturation endonuclease Nob1
MRIRSNRLNALDLGDIADRITEGEEISMASSKQRRAARENVKKAQSAAKEKQTLKHLSQHTRSALGAEAAAVRRGDEPTRRELEEQARKLDIRGRSKMAKEELKRAVARAR